MLAQDQSAAVITSPRPGEVIAGLVAIIGTAAPPDFQRYELAFSYDADTTDTWFTVQAAATAVTDGLLGRWDTAGITDGLYVLRLRVYTSERGYVEALVRGVRVQNLTPTDRTAVPSSTTPAVTPTTSPATATPEPTATAPLIALPPAATPRPTASAGSAAGPGHPAGTGLTAQAVQAAFSAGVQLTLIVFGILGVYAGIRAVGRAVWRGRSRP